MCRAIKERKEIRRRASLAFTVTELMVAVSLMSVVIYALYSVFNQTQRALRANESQVDTTERGRGILELIARDMELVRVGNLQEVTNFYARPAPRTRIVQTDTDPASAVNQRTNFMDTVYYLTQKDRRWLGVGYALYLRNPTNEFQLRPTEWAVGSLYRFETIATTNYGAPTTNLFREFFALAPDVTRPTNIYTTNFNHIADGVVHFKVTPYDTQGHVMAHNTTNRDPRYIIYRASQGGARDNQTSTPGSNANNATAILQAVEERDTNAGSIVSYRSNAAPAYIEIELGVLDPETLKTFELFHRDEGATAAGARRYVEKRVGKVQIFRKRIPLRTVSP
jgi:hypothetical protein